MDESQKTPYQKFGRLVSRDPFDGGTVVKHGAIDCDHGNDVRKILNEIAEAVFAASQDSGRFQALPDVAEDSQDGRSSAPLGSTGAHFDGHRHSVGA